MDLALGIGFKDCLDCFVFSLLPAFAAQPNIKLSNSVDQNPCFVLNSSSLHPLTPRFGHFLPAASFLRILRLARVFRIFKSVRHLDMMQVLGMTLWKSMGMVFGLFLDLFATNILCCLISKHAHSSFGTVCAYSMVWMCRCSTFR